MEPVKVVIRYANGKLLKGYTNDFFPNKHLFHVHPVETGREDKGIEVLVNQLKAVFFVKDFAGDPSHYDQKLFAESESVCRILSCESVSLSVMLPSKGPIIQRRCAMG